MSEQAKNLLLVDDDASSLRVLSRILCDHPDQRLATSGALALELARSRPPDLMLIDMEMPGMSGAQLCATLKSDPDLARIPILFVTTDDSEATRLEALQLGAADFITKPISAEQLKSRVAAVLSSVARIEHTKNEVASAGASTPELLRAGPSRLLVVDDDAGAIEMLRHTLKGIGEVHSAVKGSEALFFFKNWRPDLVIVDALMAGMDGFEVCARMRDETGMRHVPIIFVTRLSDPRYESRALDLGAADFIAKPYSPAVLKARVRNLLELKRRNDIELAVTASQGQRLAADRLAAAVQGASDGIVILNATGQVALMNAAAGRMLEVDHLSAPGLIAHDILGDRVPDLNLDPSTPPHSLLLPRADGSALPAEVSISTVGQGEVRLTTLMFRDLTERQQLQAEASARVAAEAANRTKALMISYVAHELGNPLNCILGFAQLLRVDRSTLLTTTQAHRLAMIEAGCTQLNALVNDLSALGHLELGKLKVEPKPTDALAAVDHALQTTSGLAQMSRVELSFDRGAVSDRQALADGVRLQQCLVNLISNAIKYNKPGGQVKLTLRELGDDLEIAITDTGIGMSEDQLAHLFEPFNRLGRQSAAAAGTGLGLVITRQLIEAMGGSLNASSRVGEGSCFAIRLPMAGTQVVVA